MAVHYVRFARVRVSGRWNTVLRRARKAGVSFRVNSGHRTILQQWRLFIQNMHLVRGRWVPKPGRPLTAFPSPLAPHIRTGRPNHALDVDQFHGDGVQGLAAWLRKHGAHPMFTVPGEPWHIELSAADLLMLWRKFR